MITTTLTNLVTIASDNCPTCGVLFATTKDYDDQRRKDGRSFYCPNGHSLSYGKSEADKLREQLRRSEAQKTHYLDQAAAENRERKAVERQLAAQKGQATKLRNRLANGVCPCCNRTFANLSRHMTGQHPDYAESTS